jgi:hypothetical protein
MPFDFGSPLKPRLIHPDEPPLLPDGELDLPADLAALAEQLGDDAAHLSACYSADYDKADRSPQVALAAELVQSAARIKRQHWFRSAAVVGTGLATVAALGISLIIAARQAPQSNPPRQPVAVAPTATSDAASPSESFPVSTSATLSVGELSGPELEAILDLLDNEPRSVASISF